MRFRSYLTIAAVALSTALAGCTMDGGSSIATFADYGAKKDSGYTIPAIPIEKVDKKFRRQVVKYDTKEKAGTIVVDTSAKHLYYVMGDGKAMRYGIGVGREGFEWSGTARIGAKRAWPVWTPPPAMIKRQPELKKWASGMPPGPKNALGARAMYLHNKKGDTGYRLHGTPEWASIGKAMSSGCVRMMNQDVVDLYNRASVGAKVIVR
ncbi:MAG: L,D-transpeptidase [Rhizobiaceae bacterium]|nr:L,D-transpeptidase [Rhizobiaceae bacterium]